MLTIKIVNVIKARYVLAFHKTGSIKADGIIVSATKVAHTLSGVNKVDVELVNIRYSELRFEKETNKLKRIFRDHGYYSL